MEVQESIRLVLRYLHLVGFAALLGGFVAQYATGRMRISVLMRVGLGTMIGTGLLLALPFLYDETGPSYTKLATKFGVVIGIGALFGLAVTRERRGQVVHRQHFLAIGGLVLVDSAIAVFWR